MMERFGIAGLVLALSLGVPVKAQNPKEQNPNPQNPFEAVRNFSATMVGGISGPKSDGKIYRLGDLMRADLLTEYMVTDLRTDDTFAVIYTSGVCLEGSVPSGRTYPFSIARKAKVTQVDRGEETVKNHPTKIEEVTIAQEGRPDVKLLLWEAKDLQGFPIKMRRAATPVFGSKDREAEYTDVQLGPPDPALFVKPLDCSAAPRPPAPTGPPRKAPEPPAKSSSPQK